MGLMGKRNRYSRRQQKVSPRGDTFDLTPSAAVGSFPGTDWSSARGYVYFPTLDSEREVDSWSRTELLRRSRALYNGVGFVRGTITFIARMTVGSGLTPQPMTGDSDL